MAVVVLQSLSHPTLTAPSTLIHLVPPAETLPQAMTHPLTPEILWCALKASLHETWISQLSETMGVRLIHQTISPPIPGPPNQKERTANPRSLSASSTRPA